MGIIHGIVLIAINLINDEGLSKQELYIHAVITGVIFAFFQWLFKEQKILNSLNISDKWKYQISEGIWWGVFMSTIILFNKDNQSILKELIASKFYFKLAFFILIYVFVFGHFSWKLKLKREKLDKQ